MIPDFTARRGRLGWPGSPTPSAARWATRVTSEGQRDVLRAALGRARRGRRAGDGGHAALHLAGAGQARAPREARGGPADRQAPEGPSRGSTSSSSRATSPRRPSPPEPTRRPSDTHENEENRPIETYTIVVTHYGGADALRVVQEEGPGAEAGRGAGPGASWGVSLPDVMAREGIHPETPKLPFTPGWDLVGVVDRLAMASPASNRARRLPLCRSTAPTRSTSACLSKGACFPMQSGLDAAEAGQPRAQLRHRVPDDASLRAHLKPGQRVLVHGASGGVGTALLQLGRLAGLEMYGTCSARGAQAVSDLGGTPIDYRTQDYVEEIHRLTGEGVDVVFDPIGGSHMWHSRKALRPGGQVVAYGNTTSLRGPASGFGPHRAAAIACTGSRFTTLYIAGGLFLPAGSESFRTASRRSRG